MDDITLALLGDREAEKCVTERGDLLPCPICGETEVKSCYVLGDFWFQCNKCGCSCGFHSSEKWAHKDWNTRAPLLTPAQLALLKIGREPRKFEEGIK